jgi:hypothetical protein
MSLEENKAVVRRLFEEVWNRGDIEVLDEIIAPQMIDHRNNGTSVLSTPQDQKELFCERLAGFDNIQVTCDDLIAERDRVALRWAAVAVDGKADARLRKVHICIYRIEKRRIAETWTCF